MNAAIKGDLAIRYGGMVKRCYDKTSTDYPNYGGKGVTVCDEWLNSFEEFYTWCLNNGYKKELQLDKDELSDKLTVSKIYSPQTCQFVTKSYNSSLVKHEKTLVHRYSLKGDYLDSVTSDEGVITIDKIGYLTGNIFRVCKGERNTAYNYQWRYDSPNYKNNIGEPPERKSIAIGYKMLDPITLKVIKEFKTQQEACEYFGTSNINITAVINGERKTAKGYKWAYIN